MNVASSSRAFSGLTTKRPFLLRLVFLTQRVRFEQSSRLGDRLPILCDDAEAAALLDIELGVVEAVARAVERTPAGVVMRGEAQRVTNRTIEHDPRREAGGITGGDILRAY